MKMVSVKFADLTGAALDWAVAQAAGLEPKLNFVLSVCTGFKIHDPDEIFVQLPHKPEFHPSTDWSQGGPLIESCGVSWICVLRMSGMLVPSRMGWAAWIGESDRSYGDTPLIAAMRAIVAKHTRGDTVEVPAELVGGDS